jgi:hypothetical protein
MSYVMLIVEPKGQRRERSQAEGEDLYRQMTDYAKKLKEQQLLVAVNSLREAAVRVNVRNGKSNVIDGPFTEARELVGGFFLLNVTSREEALRIARECPAAQWATVEVRETGPCYE